jgi:hypothetical protein
VRIQGERCDPHALPSGRDFCIHVQAEEYALGEISLTKKVGIKSEGPLLDRRSSRSPRVSLPYSAKYGSRFLSPQELCEVKKCPRMS